MAGDFDVSDEDYAADVAAMRVDMRELSKAMRVANVRDISAAPATNTDDARHMCDVANPLHWHPEVEDAPRDPQPARLTLGEP